MNSNERYFRYCTWREMNRKLRRQGRKPYSATAAEIFIVEIKKEEYNANNHTSLDKQ